MARLFFLLVGLLVLASCESAKETPYLAPVNVISDPGETVEVQPGDTVYSISRRYKVSMSGIIDLNHLQPPFALQAGTPIILPAKQIMSAPHSLLEKAQAQAADVEAQLRQEQGQGQESPGTQLYRQEALPQLPTDGTVVYTSSNQRQLRDLAKQAAIKPVIIEGAPAPEPQQPPILPPPQRYDIPAMQPKAKASLLKRKPVAVTEEQRKPKAPVLMPGRFIWPVQGRVVSDFGPKPSGGRNEGINIAAGMGTPVAAADGGTVAYAGNGIPGFGNVVLVRHPDGYITTYAHLERMFVERDVAVAKGDLIGTVGTSGGLGAPQLHFEIRQGAVALDPSRYLATR
ncbi:MAG TPA: M23 family metallopeptidase [Alphaproteobacteria bacterium]|nr:M23 family metallopeptidase [Alphaproteobacteria bacterium]